MALRRILLVAMLALGGVLVAACGDDDDGGGGSGGSPGGGGGGGGGSDFCDLAQEVEDSEDVDFTDEEAFDQALDQLQEAADQAPDEIQDDVQLVLDALQAFQEGDFDAVDEEELTQAGENIEQFLADECGIEAEST